MLVTTPLDVEFREGLFRVTDRYSDDVIIRRAIPPEIYIINQRRAQAAFDQWRNSQRRDPVVDIRTALLDAAEIARLGGS